MPHKDRLTSLTIDYLRFPMAALVVICHCKLLYGIPYGSETIFPSSGFNQYFQIFISEVLPHIAVPMFAMISGYLFFMNVAEFNKGTYLKKLQNRAKSLFLPYIIWCTIAYVISCLHGNVEPSFIRWIQGLWNTGLWTSGAEGLTAFSNFPADMPLWFVRDLIMMAVISPVIYLFIKKTGIITVIVVGIWWYVNLAAHITGFSSTITFFFILGSYLSIKKTDLAELCIKYRYPLYISSIILVAIDFVILCKGYVPGSGLKYNWWVFNAYTFLGTFAAFAICADTIRRRIAVKAMKGSSLSSASFFVFAAHGLFYSQTLTLLYSIFRPASDIGFLLLYLLGFTIVIILCVGTYHLLNRICPKLSGILTGNRTRQLTIPAHE